MVKASRVVRIVGRETERETRLPPAFRGIQYGSSLITSNPIRGNRSANRLLFEIPRLTRWWLLVSQLRKNEKFCAAEEIILLVRSVELVDRVPLQCVFSSDEM